MNLTRREFLASAGAAATLSPTKIVRGAAAPAARGVAVAKCATYDSHEVTASLKTMFDQLGGIGKLVRNKTVTVKLNMTGNPKQLFQNLPLGETHYVHPEVAAAAAHLIGAAGARRIRFVESAWQWSESLESYFAECGWDARQFAKCARRVEFENTNNLGQGKKYIRFKVPEGSAYIFPGYDLNHSYYDTDVFVSVTKLKNHLNTGVTLSLKNCFGNTPASIYGADAGIDEPNERPRSIRIAAMHEGARAPSKSAPQELDRNSPRDPGYRMPRIVAELALVRSVDFAVIDGVTAIAGGQGPWIPGVRAVQPGVLVAGFNPVNTDAVAAAIMGYDPRAERGARGFPHCDNMLMLAERISVGSADLSRIEVAGVPIAKALYRYDRG